MKNGWISLHRKTIQTDWYTNIPAKVLAVHLLLRVNETPETWHGVTIERGSFVTSRAHLSEETGLTERQVRTGISKLVASGFCTVTATKQSSIITVCKFDEYQTPTRRRAGVNSASNKTTENPSKETTNAETRENHAPNGAQCNFSDAEKIETSNETTEKTSKKATTNNKDNNINISVVNDNKGENQNLDLKFIPVSEIPQLLDDEQYLSSVAFGKFITPEHVRELIPEFVNQLVASGETRKEVADAKKHFNNWIRKRADMERAARMITNAQANINAKNGNNDNQSGNARRPRRDSGKSDSTGGKLHKPTNRGK